MHIDQTTVSLVLFVMLSLSESLALIPSVKANSIFQMVQTILKALVGKKSE